MLQKTKNFLKQQKINLSGEKIVIGLSGGMDSVCLFHVLKDLGCELEAVHVHHQILICKRFAALIYILEICIFFQ